MRYSVKKIVCAVAGVMLAIGCSSASSRVPEHSSVDWTRAENMSGDSLARFIKGKSLYPTWIHGTSCFYYNVREDDGTHYYIVDAPTGKRKDMIRDRRRFVKDYARMTGDTLDAKDLTIYGLEFPEGDPRKFIVSRKGKKLVYDIASGRLREHKKRIRKKESPADISADGLKSHLTMPIRPIR